MPPAGSRSFTLLELIMVIALMGIFTSLVAVNLHGFGANARLDASVRLVSDVIALARNEAGVTGKTWSIEYEAGQGRIWLQPPDGLGEPSLHSLPGGVTLRAVSVSGLSTGEENHVSVKVRPNGLLTPHTICLEDRAGRLRTVSPNPVTGAVSIPEDMTERD